MVSYEHDAIVTHQGLSIVRNRPTAFLPDVEHAGLAHCISEIIDNSFDEMTFLGDKGETNIILFKDVNIFQIAIIDNGRGIPPEKLLEAFTIPHTSGKYSTDSYKYSSGLFGLGAKVAGGLSNKLRVITSRPDKEASLYIEKGIHSNKVPVYKGKNRSGVIVFMEPDDSVFIDTDTYIEASGIDLILRKLKKYSYFHNSRIRFFISDQRLDDEVWNSSINKVYSYINYRLSNVEIIFDSVNFNKDEWIKNYFGIHKGFDWVHEFNRRADNSSSLAFIIQLFYSSQEQGFGKLGIINGVSIDAGNSNHLSEINKCLMQQLERKFTGPVRKFFMEAYKLPIYIAVEVMYEGAEFTGTTKHAFYSSPFREEYSGYIRTYLNSNKQIVDDLFSLIEQDVQDKYLLSVNGRVIVKNINRLYQDLNFPNKFTDCTTKDRSHAELFIVEGDSAGGGIKAVRNGETQAIYSIRGKPRNAIDTDDFETTKLILQGDAIYQDLIRILGIDIKNPDMNKLYFNKILILCDADPDGRHIASILLGNLYALCPELINSGKIYLVQPPYYGLEFISGRRKISKKQYIMDKPSLIHWLTQHVYKESLDINIKFNYDKLENKSSELILKDNEYDDFIRCVIPIGEALETLSKELVIPPLLLEVLTHITQYFEPDKFIIENISEIIGSDQVYYNEHDNILTISIGREDYVIPLYRVRERLYHELLPMLNVINWKQLEIYITYKHIQSEKRFVSIGQLYEILKELDKAFHIKQYKGLGGMNPYDCYLTSMDPNHRTVQDIVRIDNIDTVANLLGRNSYHRKQLLQQNISR